jgi:Kef-type K+ transport system membrane component KefB/nucleotide-binding universal stress UspA family protein
MVAGVPLLAMEALRMDHPVVVFAAVMVILLVAPLLFERLRIPGMVGLIAAGVALGPHGAGFFANDATFGLLGTVGLLYLMFLAGLEINAAEFRANSSASLVFGTLTFAVPMTVGTLLARRVLPEFSWMQAVLLASMFASHTLLPHPIAARLGLARHRAVVTTVGGTILTDTAALLVLAVVAEVTRTQLTSLFLARQMGLLAAFVWLVLWGVPRLGYWFFRRIEPDGTAEFVFVIAVVFVAALGALLTGVEAIIGAFLAGIALSSLVPEQGVLRNRLEFSGHALFIPFFLLKVGMLVDPRIFGRGWGVWRVALFMCAVVVATKWAAAVLSARLLGFSRDEGRLVFGLSVNQAAATLAAVLVGCEIGLFDETVLNGTIMMILATCILGPWVTERCGRRVAEAERHAETPWRPHPNRVVAAIGASHSVDRVLDLAMLLAPSGEGRIHALYVAQEGPGEEREIAEADRSLATAIVRGAGGGVDVEGVTRIAANPAQGIVRAARELRASVLVLGWAGHGAASLFLFRSLLDRVLAGARSQTVVVGRWPHALGTSRRMWVVVPPLVERQEGVEEGLQSLCWIALKVGTAMTVLVAESGFDGLRAALRRVGGKLEPSVATYRQWDGVVPAIRRDLKEGDLLAVVAARRSQAAWNHALERFPSLLARLFPKHNLVVVFPPSSAAEGDRGADVADEGRARDLRGRLRDRCVETALLAWSGTLSDAVAQLLLRGLGPTPASAAVRVALLRGEPVELVPDVLLVHTHAAGVAESLVLLAVGRIEVPGRETPAKALLCLVSPFSDPPERHLAILADLVRHVQRPDRVVAVVAAATLDALREAIAESA